MTTSALLVMNVQRDIVEVAGADAGYLARLRRAIDAARAAGVPVIHVVIGLRPGSPDVGAHNRPLTTAVRAGLFTEGAPGTEIHSEVAPQEGDVG